MQLPIKVITYLQDAEFEDHVIDILRSSFGDELLIETRALTTSEVLNNLFRIVVNEQRWILIHDHQKLPVEISENLHDSQT